MKRVVLVTGASSGIGKSTAIVLKEAGFEVYASARRVEKMQDLKSKGIHLMALDVTEEISIQKVVSAILQKEGRIDVLVNNAGYGSYGAIEDVSMEEARRQFEVNIFGLARLTQLVLPSMRKNHYGKIINISSVGGKLYTLFGGWYHATKHALEGFSDSLRIELLPFGIDVVVIEPGGIKTEWGIIAAENLRKTSLNGAYQERANKVADGFSKMYGGDQLSDPKVIALTIKKAIQKKKPKTRYAAGWMAKMSLFLRKHLSDRCFDKITTRI
jgi:short-subunit dehydrogenase